MFRAAFFARRGCAPLSGRARFPFLIVMGLALSGCQTPPLDAARFHFRQGQARVAAEELSSRNDEVPAKDRVLFWMERGTFWQAAGDAASSSKDFIAAAEHLEKLETYRLSQGAASLVINDTVQEFRGVPYERTLLHAMTAMNHFSVGRWDDAAVEARRLLITLDPEHRGEYPEDAFSRYVAGFAFEMIDDPSNAALQYRLANARTDHVRVDDRNGRLSALPGFETGNPAQQPAGERDEAEAGDTSELVVFILLGDNFTLPSAQSKSGTKQKCDYAEIMLKGRRLGRSFPLADTQALFVETERLEALRKAVKSGTRFVFKEMLAEAAAQSAENDAVGDVVRFLLYGLLGHPDTRRWETLPRQLHVARVSCPPDLESFTVVVRNGRGGLIRTYEVRVPLQRRRSLWISVVRDLPLPPPEIHP